MDESDTIRERAIAAHRACWLLLERSDRTPEDDHAMVAAAHQSLGEWAKLGTYVEEQRGNWLVARTYIAIGAIEPALEFGRRTMEITAKYQNELADFDRAFAKELAARAWALAGNTKRARIHRADARMLGEAISDEDDRREFFRQFDAGPWFRIDDAE